MEWTIEPRECTNKQKTDVKKIAISADGAFWECSRKCNPKTMWLVNLKVEDNEKSLKKQFWRCPMKQKHFRKHLLQSRTRATWAASWRGHYRYMVLRWRGPCQVPGAGRGSALSSTGGARTSLFWKVQDPLRTIRWPPLLLRWTESSYPFIFNA